MFITKMSLPRRTFLRGIGASVALPFLDAMAPALTAMARTAASPVKRLGFIYVPNGIIQDKWVPTGVGRNFEMSTILSPIASFQKQLVVVSGLSHRQADSFGDGNGDHERGTAVWLSGVHAWDRRVRPEARLGVTADQIAAQELGKTTLLPSLELALENPTQIACDTGDCFYSNTISWRNETTPNPMEAHPRVVFERLFGDGGSPEDRARKMRKTGSVLDSITQEVASLQKSLGVQDRSKLTEYLDSVREVEQRVSRFETQDAGRGLPSLERPVEVPEAFEDHAKLMLDLQALAYQADVTRVFTLLMAREGSPRTYPQIGVPDQHHSMSHHRDQPELVAKKLKIDTYHIQLFAYFLEKLRSTPDGDGSLLDHSMILYGCGLGNGNLHEHTNVPALLAGGCAGQLAGGRHLACPLDTPMTNLLLSMLDKAGVQTPEKIGDSTGHLSGL